MKAGLLGQGRQGSILLEAIQAVDDVELLAVGGVPFESGVPESPPTGARVYQDYRSLIVEQPIDVLFVAGRVPSFMDYLLVAAGNEVDVWRTAPPSRSLEQLARAVETMEQARVRFEVARSWCYHPSYRALADPRESLGDFFLGRAALWGASNSVNASEAGGPTDLRGLLNSGYDLIDALICNLGMPQAVFANACDSAHLDHPCTAGTADTAVIALRYANGPSATISISEAVSRGGQLLRLDGVKGCIAVNDRLGVVCSEDGTILAQEKVLRVNPYVHQIQDLAARPDDPERQARTAGRSHIITMAVIEAAALSARTGEAESPSRMIEIQGFDRTPPLVRLRP